MYIEMTKEGDRGLTEKEMELRREAYLLGYSNGVKFARNRLFEAIHLHFTQKVAFSVLKTFDKLVKPF